MESRFFKEFKRQKKNPLYREQKQGAPFYFGLFSDDVGVYVKTVNPKLKDKKVNHENYSGLLREVLELYNIKKMETKLLIDWNNPYAHIYLDRNPDLLERLKDVGNIVDHNGKQLIFADSQFKYHLNIEKKENYYDTKITLCNSMVDKIINQNHAIIGSRILNTQGIGERFKSIVELNTTVIQGELELYLTLVFSNFKNIKVNFLGFSTVKGYEIDLTPALVVQGVDDSGYITLKGSFSYKDKISPQFYIDFRPVKMAIVNYETKEIIVCPIVDSELNPTDKIIKILTLIERDYDLDESFHIEEDTVIVNPKLGNIIFNSELKNIIENFNLFGDKELKKRGLKKATPNMELLLTTSIDYLEGAAFLKYDDYKLPLFEAVSHFDNSGYIPLKDGEKGLLDRRFIEKIKKVIRESKEGVKISFFDLPYIIDEMDAKVKGEGFKEKIASYRDSLTLSKVDIKVDQSKLKGRLRDYQEVGVKWLKNLHNIGVSGCLADDMGLGKTIQTINLLQNVDVCLSGLPTLVVLPKSLIFNWIKEVEKFSPELSWYSYYGSSRDIEEINKHNLIFTTYHTLRNDIDKLKKVKFFYAILDEIQHIKNHTSQIAKASYLIDSRYKLGISGTPVENSLGDLYSISRFLNPTLFGSLRSFKDNWSGPLADDDSEIVTNILRNRIKPLFLRRVKEDVLTELPPKSEQVIYVDMSPKQLSYYEKVRKDYHDKIRLKIREEGIDKSKLTIIKAFMELRQIATVPEVKTHNILTSPKREALVEHLIDTIDAGHKVIVFSNFLKAIDGLSLKLTEEVISHRIITGKVNNREDIVDEFMEDPDIKVLIMTLKTGGVGLNLTAANYVYIMDPWWNVAAENQAIDRTHRIGQENPVFCYRFISRGTIEEKILDLQEKKRELFDNLFSPHSGDDINLTEESFEYLLG